MWLLKFSVAHLARWREKTSHDRCGFFQKSFTPSISHEVLCLSSHLQIYTLSFYFVPPCPPHLLLSLLPSPPSLARHAASPAVGNVNGLSLLGVVAPSLASQANLQQPLRWGQHTRSLQQSVGAKNRTMWKDDDRFRLGLGGLYRPPHTEHSRAGSRLPSQGRAFLTVLCFESTRTWHMPQIVCSHHAADPCAVVIGDRALLSAAEGACSCVCATETFAAFVCAFVCFRACMCLVCARRGA